MIDTHSRATAPQPGPIPLFRACRPHASSIGTAHQLLESTLPNHSGSGHHQESAPGVQISRFRLVDRDLGLDQLLRTIIVRSNSSKRLVSGGGQGATVVLIKTSSSGPAELALRVSDQTAWTTLEPDVVGAAMLE
jgi:hypothetical protein